MPLKEKLHIAIKPTGEAFSQWTYYDLPGHEAIVHQLPGYTYDYPQFLGVPVVLLASIGRKVETEVFECALITNGVSRQLQYSIKKRFDVYNDLIIAKQFPAYWDDGEVVIKVIIRGKVARDGLYFSFLQAIGNGEEGTIRCIDFSIKAQFAVLTRFCRAGSTAHNTSNGGLIDKQFIFKVKSDKDIHEVPETRIELAYNEEVDFLIIGSRIPMIHINQRFIFWGTIFIVAVFLLFANVVMVIINLAHVLHGK